MPDPALTLTVVGCGPAWTNPGEPCSSYLVEAGGARILLDCGSGAFAALQELDPRPLDAVVLSHLHFDHCADLIPFGYSRMYAGLREWPPPRLLAPPGRPRAARGARGGRRCAARASRRPLLARRVPPGRRARARRRPPHLRRAAAPGNQPQHPHRGGGKGALLLGRHGHDARARRHAQRCRCPALRGDLRRRGGVGRRAPLGGGRGCRGGVGGCRAAAARARRCGQAGGSGRRGGDDVRRPAGGRRPGLPADALDRRQHGLAIGGRGDGVHDRRTRGVLREVPVHAREQRGADDLGLEVGGQHQDARRRPLVPQCRPRPRCRTPPACAGRAARRRARAVAPAPGPRRRRPPRRRPRAPRARARARPRAGRRRGRLRRARGSAVASAAGDSCGWRRDEASKVAPPATAMNARTRTPTREGVGGSGSANTAMPATIGSRFMTAVIGATDATGPPC